MENCGGSDSISICVLFRKMRQVFQMWCVTNVLLFWFKLFAVFIVF